MILIRSKLLYCFQDFTELVILLILHIQQKHLVSDVF